VNLTALMAVVLLAVLGMVVMGEASITVAALAAPAPVSIVASETGIPHMDTATELGGPGPIGPI